jgi:hypothetical protein
MKLLTALVVILLFVIMFVCFPFAIIWALNLLFSLSIAYTFQTWLAIIVLAIALQSTNNVKVKLNR